MAKQYKFRKDGLILYGNTLLQKFFSCYSILQADNLIFAEYEIKDEDTPENMALRMYGDSSLSWTILWLNDMTDPFYDWPMNTREFDKYINNKYGDDLYEPHHYELDGKVVNSNVSGAVAVTNYDYETLLNNRRRIIYVLSPDMIGYML